MDIVNYNVVSKTCNQFTIMPPSRNTPPSRDIGLKNALAAMKIEVGKGLKPNVTDFARRYNVPRSTLNDHFTGQRTFRHQAHESQQFLNHAQELVLLVWLQFWASLGLAKKRFEVMNKAYQIAKVMPGSNWFARLSERHCDKIYYHGAKPLDGKRASGFNRVVVERHLREWETCIQEWGIPVENIYNMDEKGIQMGGPRNGSGQKYVLSREEKKAARPYVVKSDSLELVTVIEAVCADGAALSPGFVTQEGNAGAWWDIPGVGG